MTTKLGVIALAAAEHGGTYQYTLSTLQALRHAKGLDVTVYGDPENRDFKGLGFPIKRFEESRARQFEALFSRRLRLTRPDLFVQEDVLFAPIYCLSLLHTSKPFVYTLHDLQEKYYPNNFSRWQRVWRHQVHRALLGRASLVICESRHVQADIVRFFNVGEQQISVIAAPPQLHFLSRMSPDRLSEVRLRFQLPEKYLFYPSQFWVHKNHIRLLEAFRQVETEVPGLRLVLTGKRRDQFQHVMETVARLELTAKVIHLGYVEQNDLQALYQLATALVMPSLFESISIPIYEAFQVGTPVAASNLPSIAEQVGDDGILFDPKSVSSMRDAIMRTITNGAAARRRAEHARERMRNMTTERYAEQLQQLFSDFHRRQD